MFAKKELKKELNKLEGRVADLEKTLKSGHEEMELLYFADQLYEALEMAAKRNEVHNVMEDGTKVEYMVTGHPEYKLGPVAIDILPRNGSNHTILVGLPDLTCSALWSPDSPGYIILQADIDLSKKGKELHVHYGPYGDDFWYPINLFPEFKRDLTKRVEEYRLFPTKTETVKTEAVASQGND